MGDVSVSGLSNANNLGTINNRATRLSAFDYVLSITLIICMLVNEQQN